MLNPNYFSKKFEAFLLFYILLQPILDLLTSFTLHFYESSITVGIVVRLLVLVLCGFFLMTVNDTTYKKTVITYIAILAAFFVIHLLNNIIVKEPMSLVRELTFITKIIYIIVIIFSYIFIFKKLSRSTSVDWNRKIVKYIVISMIITGSVMLISALTGTEFKSYVGIKVGHVGWFFAGNDLGAIMAISFGVVVFFAIKNTTSIQTTYYWIPALLLIYSLLAIGTKVGYGTVLIILSIALFMLFIEYIKARRNHKPSVSFINIPIAFLILIAFIIYTPFSPVAHNTNIHLGWLGALEPDTEETEEVEQPDEIDEFVDEFVDDDVEELLGEAEDNKKRKDLNKKQLENFVLSGRETFLDDHRRYFSEAPLSQQLLGMGYGGNYEDTPKMIEMDFYDIFYATGIIGFILYFLPFLYFFLRIIYSLLTDFWNKFNLENALFGSSLLIGLGIAYTAGHVFTSPGVSIYLAIVIAYLVIKFKVI